MDTIETSKDERTSKPQWSGTLFVMTSAASFGTMGLFAKFAYQAKVNVITLTSLRFLIAAVIMWLVLLVKREAPRVTWKQLLALAALGAGGFALMASLYLGAVSLIPASLAAIVVYTHPAVVTVLSVAIYHETVTRTKLVSLLMSMAGLALAVGVVFAGINMKGIMYALGNALASAIYIVFSNKLVGKINSLVMTTYIVTAAAVVLTLSGCATASLDFSFSIRGWLSVLGIAVISTVAAIWTFFLGMRTVGPSRTSIISTLDPVVAVLLSFVFLSERMTFLQLLGGCLVVGAALLIQTDTTEHRTPKTQRP